MAFSRRPGPRMNRGRIATAVAAGGAPAPVPGPDTILAGAMFFWLRGDSVVEAGGLITEATDLSGNARHFTNAGGTARPTLANVASANNQPGMVFNGTTNRLDNTSCARPAPGTTPSWFWAVLEVGAWSSGELLFNAVGSNVMQMLPAAVSPGLSIRNPTQVLANTGLTSTFPSIARIAWEFTNSINDYLHIRSVVVSGSNAGNNSTTGIRIAVNNTATVFYPMTLLEYICCDGFPGVDKVAQLEYYGTQRYGSAAFT